jgi:hypothetical protein
VSIVPVVDVGEVGFGFKKFSHKLADYLANISAKKGVFKINNQKL